MAFRKIEAGLVHGSVDNFIGKRGTLFYDISDGALRLSDGTTAGGNLISSGGSGYTLPTASASTKGGVKIGSNITITDGVISVAAPFSGSYTDLTNKPSLFSGSYTDLTNKPTIPSLTGYATETYVTTRGYLTSYTETDPVFAASDAAGITSTDISNWGTAYGWGDHADAGYLTTVDTVIKVADSFSSQSPFKSEVVAELNNGVRISTWWGLPAFATEERWRFDYDGILTFPDGTEQATAWTGTSTALQWTAAEFFPNATATATVTAGDGSVDINLVTGMPGESTSVNWAFTNQGTIEFPDGTTQTSAYTGDSSTTEALTIGTGLSGTSFNGSTAVTIALEDNYGDTKNPYASKTAKYFLAAPNAANGAPTFRAIVASDIPTLNQNTTGSAATLTTARSINGVSFNGSADITVTAAAGTLTGTTLASGVTASSLTSVGTLNGLTVSKSTTGTALSITASNAAPYGGTATWNFVGNGNIGGVGSWIQFPDSTLQTTAYTGNAATVTNGVYTTDTGTVTNTMLAGSIANNKLANSSITINGSSTALGGSVTISTITGNAGTATKLATARAINGVDFDGSAAITVTAAAGTLTGTTLNSSVVSSSLTSVGTLTGVTSNAATAFIAGDAAISGVALQMPREGALRNLYNGANNNMYFDVSIGGASHGQFQFRSSSSFTNVLTMSPTAFNVNPDAVVTAKTASFGRLAWNSAIDTELTIDDYRFRISNQGGIFPQVISNTGGTKNSAWVVVAARSGSAINQTGSTGTLVPNNSWTSLYTSAGMDSAGDTYVATLQDKNEGRIYRITFMRSDNGSTTGYNIIAERLL